MPHVMYSCFISNLLTSHTQVINFLEEKTDPFLMAMLRYLTSSVEFLFLKQLSKVNWVNGLIHFLKLCSERLDKSNYFGGQKRLRKKYLS